jgi:Nucleotidyl transferase of unknown function (DUF2204)
VGEAAVPPAGFQQALRDLLAWLDETGVPGVVIGGVAASMLGRPRLTKDIDLLVAPDEASWDTFVEAGRTRGIEPRIEDAVGFARRSRVLLLRHQPSGLDVDVTLAGMEFETGVIGRGARREVMGLSIPLASPEDLVIMKAVARRPRDIADIESLLEAHPDLDLDRVKTQLRAFSTALGEDLLDGFLSILRRHERF